MMRWCLFLLLVLLPVLAGGFSVSECEGIETSILERQGCYNRIAEESRDYRDCFQSPIIRNCIVNLAVETQDPSPILSVTEGGGPSVIESSERDRLLQQYVPLALDGGALELIEDNKIHDETMILLLPSIFSNLGLVPKDEYCDELRLGYEYDDRYGTTIEEDEKHMYNSCLAYGAALRQIRDGGEECNGDWADKLKTLYGYEKELALETCHNLSNGINNKYEELFNDRWILVETRTNPRDEPAKFVAGVTPGFYSDRYKGKVFEITVSKNSIKTHDRDVDRGFQNYDVNFQAALSGPPPEMRPGDNISLSVTLSGSGAVAEKWVGSCASAMRFEYRGDGVNIRGQTKGTICLDFKEQTLKSHFTVPRLHNGEIKIDAFAWNCGACHVQYVYRRAVDVIPTIEIPDVQEADVGDDFAWQENIEVFGDGDDAGGASPDSGHVLGKYNPEKNYCGPEGKLSGPNTNLLSDASFNYACYTHDKCYGQCSETGRSQKYCDDQFRQIMYQSCKEDEGRLMEGCGERAWYNPVKYACKAKVKTQIASCYAQAKAYHSIVAFSGKLIGSYTC